MVHLLAKEYGWSKSQIDEVYSNEATIFLKILAFEKKDKLLQEKIDKISSQIDKVFISHGNPKETVSKFVKNLEKLQNMKVEIVELDKENKEYSEDEELPELDKLNKLKQMQRSRR